MTAGLRLRSAVAAVVTAAAIGVPVATSAAPAPAAGLPSYLTARDARFSLNGTWHGARPVAGAPAESVFSSPADAGAPVWGVTCGAPAQTVSFTRTVELLGPAAGGSFDWMPYVTPGARWAGMTSLDLSVNGEHIYHWAPPAQASDTYSFPAAALKHIKVGANTFELRATRAALPAGSSDCNLHGGKLVVALQASFLFYFATDLRVGQPQQPLTIDHGTTSQIIQEFLVNLGPDRAVNGYLLVFYGSQGVVTLVTNEAHAQQCEHQGNTQWYCRFDALDPGQRLSIIMKVAWTPPQGLPNWDHEQESVQFSAHTDTPDANSANDTSQVGFIFCQDGSTLPQCK